MSLMLCLALGIHHTGLPCLALIQRTELSPTANWHAMLCGYPWEACAFLNKKRGGINEGWRVGEGRKQKESKERNCQDVKQIKNLMFINRKC